MMNEALINSWVIPASVMIAALLAMRFVLRGKISLRLQYALWAVVLVRLLVPGSLFTSQFSTDPVAEKLDLPGTIQQVYFSANEDQYEVQYDIHYRGQLHRQEAQNQPVDFVALEREAADFAHLSLELDMKREFFNLWLMGMAVMTAVIVTCNVHLACQLRKRRWSLDIPESLLPVYVTEAVPTPCVFGFFRPVIYLTPEVAKDPLVRTHVLEHELTHYRHLDHIWSVLRSLCLVLHWYNPLVWIAAKVSRADAELACDEGAMARLGESQRGNYGRTLIGLTCSASIRGLLLTATTMTGSAGSIRERIRLLMARPRNTILTLTAVILMVTLIVGCTFAGAPETTLPTETTAPGVDNDMAYQDQDLPIPEDPGTTDPIYMLSPEEAMEEYADKNPRKLTAEEIIRARDGLASTVYDEAKDEYFVTEVAAFFTSYYEDVTQLDFAEFLRYFPTSGEATEEEFQLLHRKYGEDFDWAEHPTLQTMPVPVHRYETRRIDEVTRRYANLPYQEILDRESVYYLEETGCCYNFTSDFGPGIFCCVDGFVYDGGAVLFSESAVLFLTETAGNYTIRAHLPVISHVEDGSHPMIPAELPQTDEVRALFEEGSDPWYLAALTAPYADYHSFDPVAFFSAGQTGVALTKEEQALITETYGKEALQHTVFRMTEGRMDQVLDQYAGTMIWNVDLSEFVYCNETDSYLLVREEVPELRTPEILSCVQLAKNQVRMIYRFPGESQHYCATLLKSETWKVYSNHLLLNKPENARPLTEEEVASVRLAFAPDYYDAAANEGICNPRAAFLMDMYGDISQMSRSKFLSYYPATEYCEDEEEFQLLKKKYPQDFENEQTIRDMNWPIHRIPADELRAVMDKYTRAEWDDLPYDGWYHYLEETDCYYTYYSDVGLFGFHCTGGWVYDGGAMLYNDFSTPASVLILTEENGQYYIQAHLPALVAE